MHAVTCKHAPAQCTCMHTHAAHAHMHPHNAHACVRTRMREHACTCARTRSDTRPHILAARQQIGAILLSSELCLGRPYLPLAVWPCLYCTRMATPPAAMLVVEAEWPRLPVSVGMVAQFEVSCWACHDMHKVVVLAAGPPPSGRHWPVGGFQLCGVCVLSSCCSLSVAWRFFVLAWYWFLLQSLCRMPG